PALLEPPANVLRLSLHPDGMAPRIANLPEWRAHLLTRLHRQAAAAGDARLAALHQEIRGYPGGESAPPQATDVAVPLRYRHGGRELSFFSMTAVIGAPMDITGGELALESFYPADEATARALHELAARQPGERAHRDGAEAFDAQRHGGEPGTSDRDHHGGQADGLRQRDGAEVRAVAVTVWHLHLSFVSWRAGLWFIGVQPADRDQAEPEVADLGQQPVQRGLIFERPGYDGLRVPAFDLQAAEPGRPAGVENALDADLVAGAHRCPFRRTPGFRTRYGWLAGVGVTRRWHAGGILRVVRA